MSGRKGSSGNEARRVAGEIGIDWAPARLDLERFRRGMDVELEHRLRDPRTNVSAGDPVVTGKIAVAHLNEFSDYYTPLERMGAAAMPLTRWAKQLMVSESAVSVITVLLGAPCSVNIFQ